MDERFLDKLLPYQIGHVLQLEECLKKYRCVLDASDTGTGKTYTAITLCKRLNLTPMVICPKSVINNWITVAKTLDHALLGISNYEMLKSSKYYTNDGELVECPYIDKIKVSKNTKAYTKKTKQDLPKKEKTEEVDFIFQFPPDIVLIFDEAHRCKNYKTSTSRLLLSANDSNTKIMLLSATISDKIKCFKPFGVVMNFYDDIKKFNMWIRRKMKQMAIRNKIDQLSYDDQILKIIHTELFPERGSRMKITELGDLFPKNLIISQSYTSNDHDKVDALYDLINNALEDLKRKETRAEALGKIIYARQKIEMFKLPIIIDLVEEALDSGYSVVIFVNYIDSMQYLCHHLKCDCTIDGSQNLEERQMCIDDFQSNNRRLIIAMIGAGSTGLSLHDLHGGHPRMSIISPTWSGQEMQQIFGRIYRAGSKSPALQRIVYIANTYEDSICHMIKEKLKNITAINDDDLSGVKIEDGGVKAMEAELDKYNKNKQKLKKKNVNLE